MVFLGGFESLVTPSDTFTILTADGTLSGAFNDVASGQRLNTIDGFGSFVVTYDDGHNVVLSDFAAASIPEPSTFALALLALLSLLSHGRRRRRA